MIFELNRVTCWSACRPSRSPAATTPPPSPQFAKLTFGHLPPFRLCADAQYRRDGCRETGPGRCRVRRPVPARSGGAQCGNDRLVPAWRQADRDLHDHQWASVMNHPGPPHKRSGRGETISPKAYDGKAGGKNHGFMNSGAPA